MGRNEVEASIEGRARRCAWCAMEYAPSRKGRPSTYCSPTCRQAAFRGRLTKAVNEQGRRAEAPEVRLEYWRSTLTELTRQVSDGELSSDQAQRLLGELNRTLVAIMTSIEHAAASSLVLTEADDIPPGHGAWWREAPSGGAPGG